VLPNAPFLRATIRAHAPVPVPGCTGRAKGRFDTRVSTAMTPATGPRCCEPGDAERRRSGSAEDSRTARAVAGF
jgi:hypothetical protein